MGLFTNFVNEELLFHHGTWFFFLDFLTGLLLLFPFFLSASFLSFFLLGIAHNCFLESDFDLNLVVFFEVARNGDLNDARVVLQIEEELVKMDVDASGTRVEKNQVFLHLTNAENS